MSFFSDSKKRSDKEITELYNKYHTIIYRLCFTYMKNESDASDAVQETFFRLIKKSPRFENEEHEKAWFIRTASNICKDDLKRSHRKDESLEDHTEIQCGGEPHIDEVLQAILRLPDKYKTAVFLFYYEGYTSAQIAQILKMSASTVRNHLGEARKILKEKLGGDYYEE